MTTRKEICANPLEIKSFRMLVKTLLNYSKTEGWAAPMALGPTPTPLPPERFIKHTLHQAHVSVGFDLADKILPWGFNRPAGMQGTATTTSGLKQSAGLPRDSERPSWKP